MKKYIQTLFLVCLFFLKGFSQSNEVQQFIEEGVKLHDNGDFNGAISNYKKALELNPQSLLAHYEIASSYFSIQQYDKAIEHSSIVISSKASFVDHAYIIKGSALDLSGQTKEAIKTYKKAIKKFPENHLLHYNLAYTYYNVKQYQDAEKALQKSLQIKPTHGSSHILLAYVMSDQGLRVKSILALYNFLLLEPKGKRATSAYELLTYELKKGVKRNSETETTIMISDSDESNEFRAAELMLAMLEASKNLEKNEGKTSYELFTENNKLFFSILGELKKKHKGFWWDYYVDFFYVLIQDNHIEAFSYYIAQSKEDQQIEKWLLENKDKVDALFKWSSNYGRT